MMRPRDRATTLALLGAAALAWFVLAVILATIYPSTLQVRLVVSVALGATVALSAIPLAWLAAFGRRGRRTQPGAWLRATRRGILAGGLVALIAALRVTETTSAPIVIFAIVLVVAVEVTLSYRR
jgi:uncharacterized protein YhhL (DUF1145 family)